MKDSKKFIPHLSSHIFVCLNERPDGHPRGCCKARGGEEILAEFKKQIRERGIARVRAQRAGCLDVCEKGASVVVYPDNVWYGSVRVEDVSEILEQHILEKNPVKRLLIKELQ